MVPLSWFENKYLLTRSFMGFLNPVERKGRKTYKAVREVRRPSSEGIVPLSWFVNKYLPTKEELGLLNKGHEPCWRG